MRTRDILGGPAMHAVRVGTCGWSYKDWSGACYPEAPSLAEHLADLAAVPLC